MRVRAKKYLGQHFLLDENVAREIVGTLPNDININVLEVGPGMGVLTKYMLQQSNINLVCVEIDAESTNFLYATYPKINLLHADFLKCDIASVFQTNPVYLIGNYPYNISNQIFFKLLENRKQITQCSGLIQKEVAERICSPCGNKSYGILSVLLQTYYNVEYIKTIGSDVFSPKPKVDSAIIKLKRNKRENLPCDENLFKLIVKTSFNQRRKQLRNSLKNVINYKDPAFKEPIFTKRPEQLSVEDFILLTSYFEKNVGD